MKRHRITIINAVCCAVIAATFGLLSQNVLPWILVGAPVGALIGLATEGFFRVAGIPAQRHLRGLLAVLIVEALVTLYVAIPAYSAYLHVHPTRTPVSQTPTGSGLAYEDVSLMTEDGIRLAAWYIPSQNGAAIIAVHGHGGNRSHTLNHAAILANAGYGVLAFDQRAHGESEGETFASGWESDLDVVAAVDFLETRQDVDPGRIGALGLSVGANAVIYGAAKDGRIRALVVDGTPLGATRDALQPMITELRPVFFMTPANWMEQQMIELFSGYPHARPIKEHVPLITPRPILFVGGGGDWLEAAITRRYHSLAGPSAELWLVPGAGHVGGIYAAPEEYATRLCAFFDTHLAARTW